MLVHGQQKHVLTAGDALSVKLLCQPAVIAARLPEVIRQHPAVVDEDDGQEYVVLYVQPQLLRRDRLEGTAGQHRQPAVRLQHGVLYVAQVGDPLAPQLLEQLVQRQSVAAHGLLPQLAVHDHQGRLAADQVPEAYVPQADGAEQCGQGDQRDDGNDAVEQRQGEVLHGYGGQVGDQQRQHQLDGLQLTDLSLAAEAQARDQQQIENDRAEKGSRHDRTPFRKLYSGAVCPAAGQIMLVYSGKAALYMARRTERRISAQADISASAHTADGCFPPACRCSF